MAEIFVVCKILWSEQFLLNKSALETLDFKNRNGVSRPDPFEVTCLFRTTSVKFGCITLTRNVINNVHAEF